MRVHGERFGVTAIEPPLPFGATRVHVVATRAAMTNAGVAWLMELDSSRKSYTDRRATLHDAAYAPTEHLQPATVRFATCGANIRAGRQIP